MREILANYPLNEILAFRESGYADKLVDGVVNELGEDWELYLYFELSRWKGEALQVQQNSRKKVVICIGDESARTDYSFLDQVDVIFRMYLPENQRGKVHHIPVGPSKHFVPGKIIPIQERTHNVFFSGNLHRGRAELYQVLAGVPPLPFVVLHRLRRLFGENFDKAFPNGIIRFSTGFHNGIPPEEYAGFLGNSKLVLCPAGIESPESMRHFEAASLGCIVITTPLPDVAVYRTAPFVVLPSWRELRPTVQQLLRDPARQAALHQQTLEWWRSTASPEAVAGQMVKRLNDFALTGNH